MNELSLFTGAGGGLLGTKLLGFRAVGYVEFQEPRQQILRQRIADGFLDAAPIFGDIHGFISGGYAAAYRGVADLVSGGFPCQPFSTASRGRRNAKDLWPQMLEVVRVVRPKLVFAENVAGSREIWGRVTTDLQAEGYGVRGPLALGAADLGGPDLGKRFWLLAKADAHGKPNGPVNDEASRLPRPAEACGCPWWHEVTPPNLGVADGVADRMDRLAALGDGQVPSVAARAFLELMQ